MVTKPQLLGAFKTFPLADNYDMRVDCQVTIPSPDDVLEAREWVNFKEM